ncbi:MAG: 2-C-methyl-D-erythritol 4-phosphate cytidylyltransferase [Ruminobacter sp.]|jgi:2-C-methyl-D-erythritol 4-phosphate cytidylyltransferase|nr:2-C-methyl-D-erythritol 4-phosphate cytidylyltransferase [Ruminobacter sp.]
MIKVDVIIPAAGVGKRMQSVVPKQYLDIDGMTILDRTIDKFISLEFINKVIVALSPNDDYFRDSKFLNNPKLLVVLGGKERCDSVYNGILAATSEYVLVHDAARPCVLTSDIQLLVDKCSNDNGGLLVSRIPDTIKKANEHNEVISTIPRDNVYRALTPQYFKKDLLRKAYEKSVNDGFVMTDESSAMEYLGYKPQAVVGSSTNIKITEPNDLELAKIFLQLEK